MRLRGPRRAHIIPVVVLVGGLLVVAPGVMPDCIHIDVSVSIEPGKEEALGRIAHDYNRADRRVGNRCVEVSVHGTSSGTAQLGLREGWDRSDEVTGPEPQVWLPSSSMWLELLRNSGTVSGLPEESEVRSIAQSLLVVALPRPMAEVLRGDDGEVTWQEIIDVADRGWASLDHPEWGEFLFGKDDPTRSTSGLAATVAGYYAASHLSADLTVENVKNPDNLRTVQRIEAGVYHYAPDIVDFLERLDREDPTEADPSRYVSAVVLQEQMVYEYNQGVYDDGKKPSLSLVPLYPTDGTLRLDHPFVVLPSASPAQEAAAEDFRAFLLGSGPQQRLADIGFRHRDGEDGPWVLAPDVAAAIDGKVEVDDAWLATPPGGEVLQEILLQWDELRKPAKVLLVLDTSGSMSTGDRFPVMRSSVSAALGRLPATHQVGLWTFPGESAASVHQVPIDDLADTRGAIERVLNDTVPAGRTPLYRTISEAYDYMAGEAGTDTINAIVVLSDGLDQVAGDDFGQQDLLAHIAEVDQSARKAPIRIFSIAFTAEGDYETMQEISHSTGVDAKDAADAAALEDVFIEMSTNF